MMEDPAIVGRVEFGKFDLNRLPVLWQNVEPEKIQKAVRAFERTQEQQVKELERRKQNSCAKVD